MNYYHIEMPAIKANEEESLVVKLVCMTLCSEL